MMFLNDFIRGFMLSRNRACCLNCAKNDDAIEVTHSDLIIDFQVAERGLKFVCERCGEEILPLNKEEWE